MSTNWTDSIPASGEKISTSRPEIEMNLMLLKAALGMDHLFPGNDGVDAGEHVQAVFTAPLAAKPTLTGTKGGLYTKTVDGHTELFYEKENGTEIQLTPILSSLTVSSGITNADLIKLHAITSTALELSTLYLSGITNADLVRLHAITSSAAEMSTLAASGITNADLVKLHALTATYLEINALHSAGVTQADLIKLHAITLSAVTINGLPVVNTAITPYHILVNELSYSYESFTLNAAGVPADADYVWGYAYADDNNNAYLSPTSSGDGHIKIPTGLSTFFRMPMLTARTLWFKTSTNGHLDVYISGYEA